MLTAFTSTALSTTNLVATVGAVFNDLVILDESFVPYNRYPGEGFVVGESTYDSGSWIKNCLLATSASSTTLTGQSLNGDASLIENQYRNFQLRIVEDTTTPASVGQRRRIISHTAGPSPVYAITGSQPWSPTPSINCKFVIENDNDKILFLTNSTTVYNYNVGVNQWSTATWTTRPVAGSSAGIGSEQIFGIVDDTLNVKPSMIYSYRTGASFNIVDVLDISATPSGSWTSFAMTPNFVSSITPTTGMGFVYDGNSLEGRYIYFMAIFSAGAGPVGIFRLDVKSRQITAISPIPQIAGSTGDAIFNKMSLSTVIDGTNKITLLHCKVPQSGTGQMYEAALIL